jgi:carboxylesterase type B
MRAAQKCFLLLLLFFASVNCEIVRVNDGLLEGTKMTTRKDVTFDAFLKIPFAEAPVPNSPLGNLRFQPPVKKSPWTGTWNATQYGPMCMQKITRGETWPMDEDCLHLNVFTKNLGNSTLKPVIVFIHGGSYEVGAAYNHGPKLLMDRDIVLVTVNYRFGPFGFLATGTSKAIGNMGLKDNVMALEWIRDNIAVFGGDPTQVTISGLSAGAFSVSMLILSEMSRNLFKRAILMSGAITWVTRYSSDYLSIAQNLGKEVNCTGDNFIECLQEVKTLNLTNL